MYYHRVSCIDPNLRIVLIPKVAQTSIDATICDVSSYKRCNITDFTFSEDDYIATFVRNPYTRVLSVYKDKIWNQSPKKHFHPNVPIEDYGFKKGMSFDRFVRRLCEISKEEDDRHFRSQVDLISWSPHISYLGYYERIGKDWDHLARMYKLNTRLRSRNRSKNKNDPYTKDLKKMIADRYEEDFERFGYKP